MSAEFLSILFLLWTAVYTEGHFSLYNRMSLLLWSLRVKSTWRTK